MRILVAVALVAVGCGGSQERPTTPPTENPKNFSFTPDGRVILWGAAPLWCFRDREMQWGMCTHNQLTCEDRKKLVIEKEGGKVAYGACETMWAGACSYETHTITGKEMESCFPNLRECDLMAQESARQGNILTGDGRCSVYRMREH